MDERRYPLVLERMARAALVMAGLLLQDENEFVSRPGAALEHRASRTLELLAQADDEDTPEMKEHFVKRAERHWQAFAGIASQQFTLERYTILGPCEVCLLPNDSIQTICRYCTDAEQEFRILR